MSSVQGSPSSGQGVPSPMGVLCPQTPPLHKSTEHTLLSVSQGSLLPVAGWEQFPPRHTSRVQIVSSAVQGVSSGFAGWPHVPF